MDKEKSQMHQRYTRTDNDGCLRLINEQMQQYGGYSEYALYVKAMIKRHTDRQNPRILAASLRVGRDESVQYQLLETGCKDSTFTGPSQERY
eukprot:TRINITY_DN22080_c0_g1_i1.p2 TRINITY_DN22080_c0_g1~~TRINITY_DN22080_c0_g1_i1.p2  ORF type:complete len:106 (-),score=2.57 TRINITY_DN22080_c0_g1_i1:34-309(-)